MFGIRNALPRFGALVVASGLVGMLTGSPARADLIEDPLHGQCNGSGVGTCSDNGTNTPLGNSTQFNFTISPGPQTGDLLLVALIPNNQSAPSPFEIAMVGGSTVTGVQVDTAWTSGFLDTFLTLSASPANPIGAYLPTTQFFQPSATGFLVFEFDFGQQTISEQSAGNTGTPQFTVPSGLALGSYIVAFCTHTTESDDCTQGKATSVATANSGALLVNGEIPPPHIPEPATLALVGVGLLGVSLMMRRRRAA